ncbi:MAG: MBL fold metallo-hydrolase, partial [Actinomycetota bacterium]|nr:MBL fold metallo-hydrolase [Actinomycetota bacterium]
TPELGDRSYLVHDGRTRVVIDPQRDLERMEEEIDQAGVTVVWVVETHLHNDYVSGGSELARRTGARYAMAAGDAVDVEHQPVSDGDVLDAGQLKVNVVATPGHTEHHLAYIVETDGEPPAVFTGGNLLYGTVGRTDLVAPDLTDRLTREQHRSARRLAETLPGDTRIYPTHGFGSFCSSSAASEKDCSTISEERASNDALTASDEEAFVDQLVSGLTAYPGYYDHMAAINREGPGPPDLSPPDPLDAENLRSRLRNGEWVIDLRDRASFAAHHLRGSVSFELGQQFSTYLGWVVPWGDALTLVGSTAQQVIEAQRDLSRIGIEHDRITGAATGSVEDLLPGDRPASFRRACWADLADAVSDPELRVAVIDVRRADEYDKSHIDNAVNLPIHELPERVGEAPTGQLWVHCGSGYRAAIASGILERAGNDVVHIDDMWPPDNDLNLTVTARSTKGQR